MVGWHGEVIGSANKSALMRKRQHKNLKISKYAHLHATDLYRKDKNNQKRFLWILSMFAKPIDLEPVTPLAKTNVQLKFVEY